VRQSLEDVYLRVVNARPDGEPIPVQRI
jgi:hypothetical protein